MNVVAVAMLFAGLSCVLALRANMRFASERRLPMQWSLNGDVTWFAPRPLALAFIPALAIVVLGIYVLLTFTAAPRAGQADAVLPTLLGLGTMLVVIQLLHLWGIARTLRRRER